MFNLDFTGNQIFYCNFGWKSHYFNFFLNTRQTKYRKDIIFIFLRLGLEVPNVNSWNFFYFMSIIILFIKTNRSEPFFLDNPVYVYFCYIKFYTIFLLFYTTPRKMLRMFWNAYTFQNIIEKFFFTWNQFKDILISRIFQANIWF